MSKRIKKSFTSSSQVIHLWANQAQDEARCGNVFFNGNTIYSYGTHYVLGKIVTWKGHKVALINDTGYSVTTSKHIREAWQAVAHLPRLMSTDLTVETGIRETQDGLVDLFFNAFQSMSFYPGYVGGKYFKEAEKEKLEAFNGICDLLGFKNFKLAPCQDLIDTLNEHVDQRIVLKAKRENDRNSPEAVIERAEKARKLAEKQINDWKQGGALTNAVRNLSPMLIRVRNGVVETSRGAEVPLDDAKTLLKAVLSKEVSKGQQVGAFTFDKVEGGIAHIGCHQILIEDAVKVLGE